MPSMTSAGRHETEEVERHVTIAARMREVAHFEGGVEGDVSETGDVMPSSDVSPVLQAHVEAETQQTQTFAFVF